MVEGAVVVVAGMVLVVVDGAIVVVVEDTVVVVVEGTVVEVDPASPPQATASKAIVARREAKTVLMPLRRSEALFRVTGSLVI